MSVTQLSEIYLPYSKDKYANANGHRVVTGGHRLCPLDACRPVKL